MKKFAVCIVALMAISGCGAPQSYRSSSYPSTFSSFDPSTETHVYNVTVIDADGNPVSGATVTWEITANGEKRTETSTTDQKGVSTNNVRVDPVRNPSIKWADYKSEAKYVVSKSGYFSKRGTLSETNYVTLSGGRAPKPQSEKVLLASPTDYLSSDFANDKRYATLRQKILDFLTVIRVESILNQADLKLHGIRMQEFKGKRYLVLELSSDNVFNSLKFDTYGIGKQVFDETVRKTLNPLNEKISDQRLFYGYNIIINTFHRNFADQYSVGSRLKYEFMMPQAAVRNYKDKNISGQKLIDESVVLLNDERIDLKLQ